MTREEAKKILGRTNSCQPWVGNMKRALEIHSFQNTPEEWKRLEACYTLLRTPVAKRHEIPEGLQC